MVTGNLEVSMAKITDGEVVRNATCSEELMAMRDSLDVLGGKWKLMILRFLANRTHQTIHFGKLLKEIGSISAKMLSKELKELETNLLVCRSVQDSKPIKVIYRITDYGQTVLPVTETLVQWGLEHRQKISSAETVVEK